MHVLIVDDNAAVREALVFLFSVYEIEAHAVGTPAEALAAVALPGVGVVIQDMNFRAAATSGEEGTRLFHQLKARQPSVAVILLTAWADLETAVALVREGADDYIAKPWDDAKLVTKVRALLDRRRPPTPASYETAGLVFASQSMRTLVGLALQVARTDAPVLITGPSGSGKERFAELVRTNSNRRPKPFVVVNAGALPAQLLEAELFGAEAGAYTGANGLRRGRFETADGGTLFLDEIGTLSLAGQAALLRVVQSGEYQRLGSSTTRRCDVRLIAATNETMTTAIAAGTFRADLYYRLAVIELAILPLAQRPDDIEPLAEHFLTRQGRSPDDLTPAARAAMRAYPWPGNVRELENRLRRAVLLATSTRIGPPELGLEPPTTSSPAPATFTVPAPTSVPPAPPVSLLDAGALSASDLDERRRIEAALTQADGVIRHAAEALGLSRQALYRRMERLGISVARQIRR